MTIRQRSKRCPALLMAMAMAWSLPACVSAADIAQNDEPNISELTANVETDVCQVVMPANTEGIFDFILDPQGLINETDGAMYKGKKFEKDCTVFFRRRDGKVKEDYSRKSDSVTITNKSTMPVEVSLEVKVDPASLAGIEMTEDRKFKKDKSASLYLAVADGKKEVPVGKDGVTIHKTIEAAPDGAYGYEYNSDTEKYEYGLKENIEENIFDNYSFQLIGAANEKGDWSAFTKAVPEIVVTWKVLPKENPALRKDAIFNGKKIVNEQKDSEQEDKQKDQEEIPRADKALDDAGTKQEQPETTADEGGSEQGKAADNDESKEELADQNGSDEEEKEDIDTEVVVGE